ncbi:MAG: GNAT family N-acetyltransferase [Bacteroidota bacterium]
MTKSNFERMLELAEQAFDYRNDPQQLNVNEATQKKLQQLHPSTLSEYNDGNGPAVWIVLIPTTLKVMELFLHNKITEQQLFDETNVDQSFEAVYLCSAMTLPEYRGKGIAKKLTRDAIENIRKQHAIKALFVWPFSEAGSLLADNIANTTGLPLYKRQSN